MGRLVRAVFFLSCLFIVCSAPAAAVDAQVETQTHGGNVSYGETITGTVEESAPTLSVYGGRAAQLRFDGSRGDVLSVEVQTPTEPVLAVLGPDGTELARRSPTGANTTRIVSQSLLADGQYTLVVSDRRDENFSYTLSLDRERRLRSISDTRSVTIGDRLLGTIDEDDPSAGVYDGHYEQISFEGSAGERLSVQMLSTGNSSLRLRGVAGQTIASQDESGTTTMAALTDVRLPADGTYTVVAHTDDSQTPLPYVLSLVDMDGRTQQDGDLESITFGETATSRVDRTDPFSAVYRGYHEAVTFPGRAGDVVDIDLDSTTNLDTTLRLEGPDGERLASNTDSKTASIPLTVLPDDGEYTIYVVGEQPANSFDYTLSLEWLGEVDRDGTDVREIAYGEIVRGIIDRDDPISRRYGTPHEPVSFDGYAGEVVTVRVDSAQSPSLALVGPEGQLLADGRGSQPTSVIADVELPADGEYTVVVTDSRRRTVEYTLSIGATELRTARRNTSQTIPIGGAHGQPDRSRSEAGSPPTNGSETADEDGSGFGVVAACCGLAAIVGRRLLLGDCVEGIK
jgi:hypothetical protein